MISVAEAERIILAAIPLAPAVDCPLGEAHGAVLREPIEADRPFPPYNRVAMDGIALAVAAWDAGVRAFPIEGIQRAGAPACTLRDPAHCMEVMTGAVLPAGCDCVVPVEQITRVNDVATLAPDSIPQRMQHVHALGSDCAAGATLLPAGTRLLGPQLAVAASVGLARVRVARRPAIAIVSTGDELVPVEATPLPHQVRRSNAWALAAGLALAGFRDIRSFHAPDDPAAIAAVLKEALATCAFVILSGGVSEGRYDHVPDVLQSLGVAERLHKVSQRPGKPLWCGVGPETQAVFGLPGNPVSAVVCLHRYVLPALQAHLGVPPCPPDARPHAVLAEAVRFKKSLTLFLPVRVCDDASGLRRATPSPMNGSGDLAGLAASDGVLEVPPGGAAAGTACPLWRWA